MPSTEMKTIKTIKIDFDKCTGCNACEVICSTFHAEPKYGIVNTKRSRIRVFREEDNDVYIPVLAGEYTETECIARSFIVITDHPHSGWYEEDPSKGSKTTVIPNFY